jgi:hypothetical protein
LPVVFVIVAVFFLACLGAMVWAEMKTLERRETTPFTFSPKKSSRTLNGSHILK